MLISSPSYAQNQNHNLTRKGEVFSFPEGDTVNTGRVYETVTECAERCKVSERTIRQAIADGILTAYRLGPRTTRLDVHEVDQAFAAQ